MFLDKILPQLESTNPTGFFPVRPAYFAFGLSPDKKEHRQLACYSYEDLIRACGSFADQGWHSYFAQAAFADDLKGRKRENVQSLRCFWADIDVGKKQNSYETREDALAAIKKFMTETGIVPTYVVSSGKGFYLYWCLEQNIKPAAWKKLATWLADIMRAEGFVFDPACTVDSARVLRMPGTVHQGCGETVKCLAKSGITYTVESFVTTLNNVAPPSWLNAPAETSPEDIPANAAFTNAFDTAAPKAPVAHAAPIIGHCQQMRLAPLGSEPTWYAMMSVLRRCVDGREWAHKLSALDSTRYNWDDTERKFDHAPQDAPAKCATFSLHNPALCAKCPHNGHITSPIQLWRQFGTVQREPVEEPEETPVIENQLPLPFKPVYSPMTFRTEEYWVDEQGCHWLEVIENKKTGEIDRHDHVITQSRLYYVRSVWTYQKGCATRQHWFKVINPNGHAEEVYMPAEALSNGQKLMAWFYNSNVFPTNIRYGAKTFMAFMNAYLNAILNNKTMVEVPTTDTFGWKEEDSANGQHEGFAAGQGLITERGMEALEYSGVAERLAKGLNSAGTLEGWKPVANMYKTLDQKAAQLAMCLSFAAPLMKYGSGVATSATYSLWSTHSGMGKTQMLRAAASVWGNPDGQWIQRQASSVARMRQLAVLNNLPAFMDELTDVKDEDLYSLAYSLVGGQEKNKLRRNGVQMAETGSWNTVTFCTSNKSIKEAVAKCSGDSSASVVRVIEYECDFKSYADDPDTTEYINSCIGACATNYGLAGPNFIWQVLRHKDRLATLTAQVEHWANQNGFSNEERFMAYPLGLAIKAGRWAKEWGLLDYDMDALERWVLTVFVPHNRGCTIEQVKTPQSVLLTYLTERQRNLLMVQSDRRTVNAPTIPGSYDPYVLIQPTHSDILLRMTADENKLFIAKSDLEKWCRQRGRSVSNLWKALEPTGIKGVLTHYNLGKDVPAVSTPIIACYMLDAHSVKRLGYTPPAVPKPSDVKNVAATNPFK